MLQWSEIRLYSSLKWIAHNAVAAFVFAWDLSVIYKLHQHGIIEHDAQLGPDKKVHGANMGPIWGPQDPGGPRVGPMNFAIWWAFHSIRMSW